MLLLSDWLCISDFVYFAYYLKKNSSNLSFMFIPVNDPNFPRFPHYSGVTLAMLLMNTHAMSCNQCWLLCGSIENTNPAVYVVYVPAYIHSTVGSSSELDLKCIELMFMFYGEHTNMLIPYYEAKV